MNRSRSVIVVLLGLNGAATAFAAPPQVAGTVPYGVRRGDSVEVTVNGTNLGANPRLVAPFGFKAEPVPNGATPSAWKFKLSADRATAVGTYPVRVLTDAGLSNPFLFSVGQLAQVNESEDNSVFESAQKIAVPAVVEGQSAANDVDYFRFSGKKGQKVLIDAQCARVGSTVDPSIRLTTAARVYVASADDSPGLLTDARLVTVLPEDTDYVIELSDSRYQGGARPIYRLVVGEVPVADEVYPIGGRSGETLGLELRGGTLDGLGIAAVRLIPAAGLDLVRPRVRVGDLDVESLPALVVSSYPEIREPADPNAGPARGAAPVVFNGRIDPPGDEDRFTLAVTPGQKLRFQVEAADAGSALDGVLQVLGAKDAVLATADDTTVPLVGKNGNAKAPGIVSPDPTLNGFTVPAGVTELTLALRDLESRGGTGFPYRIVVTPVVADFEITLADAQASIPRGGTAAVGVAVVRRGYNGPITLKVIDPPTGLSVRPGRVADGQLVGALTLSSSAEAPDGPVILRVVGEAAGPDGPIVASASKTVVFAQQATLPTNEQTFPGLAVVTTPAAAITFDVPAAPVEVAHGSSATVPVKAVRKAGADGPLAFTPLPLPPGLTASLANFSDKATEGTLTVKAAVEHPIGSVSLAVLAKGKVGGADQTFSLPGLTVNVVKPAAVELTSGALELKPGATAEVKGKVVRKSGFREPVTVKLSGLPAGTKSEPVAVPADKSEFTLKVVAEEKAAPATASASAALAFQIDKKDYPGAPSAPLSVKVVPAK